MSESKHQEPLYFDKQEGSIIRCYQEDDVPRNQDGKPLLPSARTIEEIEACLAIFSLLVPGVCIGYDDVVSVQDFKMAEKFNRFKIINSARAKLADHLSKEEVEAGEKYGDQFFMVPEVLTSGDANFYPVKVFGFQTRINLIGKGSFGIVVPYKSEGGDTVALKIIKRHKGREDNDIVVSRTLKAKNIKCHTVQHKYMGDYQDFQYLVMQSLTGSIDTLRVQIERTPDFFKISLLLRVLESCQCLAHNGLYYMDIKSANILLRCTGKDKLMVVMGDIGSMFELSSSDLTITHTLPFYDLDDYMGGKELYETSICWGILMLLDTMHDDFRRPRIVFQNSKDIDYVQRWYANVKENHPIVYSIASKFFNTDKPSKKEDLNMITFNQFKKILEDQQAEDGGYSRERFV